MFYDSSVDDDVQSWRSIERAQRILNNVDLYTVHKVIIMKTSQL